MCSCWGSCLNFDLCFSCCLSVCFCCQDLGAAKPVSLSAGPVTHGELLEEGNNEYGRTTKAVREAVRSRPTPQSALSNVSNMAPPAPEETPRPPSASPREPREK